MKKPKQYKPASLDSKKFEGFKKDKGPSLYDKDWQKYRFWFLHHNPLCYICGIKASVVDHHRPHKGDIILFKKLDNHLPMCPSHHNFVTAKFDRNEVPDTEGKIKWIVAERVKLGISIKVKVMPSYIYKK